MKAHGYAKLTWHKNILMVETYGPFNDEGVIAVNINIKESVLKKRFDTWYRIEKLDPDTMGSPGTVKIVNELYQWADAHGCCATAIVISNLIQEHAIQEIIPGKNVKVFHQLHDAQEWIAQQ